MLILRKSFLHIFIFIFIFNPTNFANFNLYFIIIAISFIYGVYHYIELKKLLLRKNFFIFIFFNIYLIAYILFIASINNSNGANRAYATFLLILLIPCAFLIVREFSRLYTYSIDNFILFISFVVIIQLAFVILTLLIPEVRLAILISSRDQDLYHISNEYGLRSFGLANGYTSTFPMFMGAFAIFCIFYFLNEKKIKLSLYFLLITILLVVSIILNARIGLFPVLFFISGVLLFVKVNKPITKFQVSLSLFILLFMIVSSIEIENYIERLLWAINEVGDLIDGEATGTFYVLQNMIFFPESVAAFLFGSGSDVFGDNSPFVFSSDIGPIRDLFVFGFLNLALYVFVLFILFKKTLHNFNSKFGVWFTISLVISLTVFYIKGSGINGSEIINFLLLFPVFYAYSVQLNINKAAKETLKNNLGSMTGARNSVYSQ